MPDAITVLDRLHIICGQCTKCELGRGLAHKDYQSYNPHIPGWRDGLSPLAKIMLVGPGPSLDDTIEGQVLSGCDGKILDDVLDVVGGRYCIDRNHFYITNLIKCFGKKPTPGQIAECSIYLKHEIRIIKPRLVITLGSLALRAFCPLVDPVSVLGKTTKSELYGVRVFATYHPSSVVDRDTREIFERHLGLVCEAMFRLECPF